jgi:integrase
MAIEQARALLAAIRLTETVKDDQGEEVEKPLVVGMRDRAILATLRFTACRAGAVAKLRLGDFQHDGSQYVLRFQEKGGKSREIPVRHDLEGFILAYVEAAGIAGEPKDRPLFRASNGRTKKLTAKPLTSKRICELVKRRLKDAGLPERLSPHSFRVTADYRPDHPGRAAGGCPVLGRARRAANHRALRQATEAGDAEYRGAVFNLTSYYIT